MIYRKFNAVGAKSRGPTITESNFTINSVFRFDPPVGGSTTILTDRDAVINSVTGATRDRGVDLTVVPTLDSLISNPRFSTLSPSIATVDAITGKVTRVINGNANILVSTKMGCKIIVAGVTKFFSQSGATLNAWISGTLGETASNSVDAKISAGGQLNLYSTLDAINGVYVRNSNCWLSAVDFSCLAASRRGNISPLAAHTAGTLITRRHVVWANHFSPALIAGTQLDFLGSDGITYSRGITSYQQVGGSDIQIGLLDADLPGAVTPAVLPPADLLLRLPGARLGACPIIRTDQFRQASVMNLTGIAGTSSSDAQLVAAVAVTGPRAPFSFGSILYDSGSPMFLLLGNNLILLATTTNSPAIGPSFHCCLSEITSTINALGAFGQSITVADLSSYPSY